MRTADHRCPSRYGDWEGGGKKGMGDGGCGWGCSGWAVLLLELGHMLPSARCAGVDVIVVLVLVPARLLDDPVEPLRARRASHSLSLGHLYASGAPQAAGARLEKGEAPGTGWCTVHLVVYSCWI